MIKISAKFPAGPSSHLSINKSSHPKVLIHQETHFGTWPIYFISARCVLEFSILKVLARQYGIFCAIVMSGDFFRGETENLGPVDIKTYQQVWGQMTLHQTLESETTWPDSCFFIIFIPSFIYFSYALSTYNRSNYIENWVFSVIRVLAVYRLGLG